MITKRVLFSKKGELVFISHLDLDHTLVRALNRAGFRVAHSCGFNPHPKLVFALPLSVGMEGENELCDITFDDDGITDDALFASLCTELPPQLCVKRVYAPDVKLGNVTTAEYEIRFARTIPEEEITKSLSGELSTVKKNKNGEKEVDLKPGIKSFSVKTIDGISVLSLVLDASSAGYLNPELVMTALKERNMLTQDEEYCINRTRIIFGE